MTARPAPQVSVIVPTRNRAETLRCAVRSVLAESEVSLELIVVDDASTDDTIDWLSRLKDDRLRLVARNHPGGAADARNCGMSSARGRFVAFLDSDDSWHPAKLQVQLRALDRFGGWRSPLLHATGYEVERPGWPVRHGGPLGEGVIGLSQILSARSGEWITSSFVVTRAALDLGVRFDAELAALEDQDLAVQVALRGGQVLATRTPLLTKTGGTDESLSSQANLGCGHQQFLEKHRSSPGWTRRSSWEHALDAAWSYRASGQHQKADDVLRTHLPYVARALTRDPAGVSAMRHLTRLGRPGSVLAGVQRMLAHPA